MGEGKGGRSGSGRDGGGPSREESLVVGWGQSAGFARELEEREDDGRRGRLMVLRRWQGG